MPSPTNWLNPRDKGTYVAWLAESCQNTPAKTPESCNSKRQLTPLQSNRNVNTMLAQFQQECGLNSDAGAQVSALTLSGEINVSREHVGSAASAAFAERRAKPRIRQSFPTRVRGLDNEGRPFDLDVGLENISSGGVYFRIPRTLQSGDELNLVVRFSIGHQGATAALRGTVLRVEPGLDGLNGIAMAIQRYEFI